MKTAPRKQYTTEELKAMLEAEVAKAQGQNVYTDRRKILIEMLKMRGV